MTSYCLPEKRTMYRRHGDQYPKTLRRVEEPMPAPLWPYDVLLRVHAVALNYRDINMLRGDNPWRIREDGIPCNDAAAEVIAVGPSVSRVAVGDRVTPVVNTKQIYGDEHEREWLGGEVDGVLASHLVFNQDTLAKIPDNLSYEEASLQPCAGLTAYSALVLSTRPLAGKTVLVQGTGGVSIMALKLALAAGARAIVTSSSDAKLQTLVQRHGATRVQTVNYKTNPAWHEEVLRLTNGTGVDVTVENGGMATLHRSLLATARKGVVSIVGYLATGEESEGVDRVVPTMIDRQSEVLGINAGSRKDLEDLFRIIEAAQMTFDDTIDRVFPFDDAANAFEYLASGAHVGKVVIRVTN